MFFFSVVFLMALSFLEDRPRHPPSPAAALQWLERTKALHEAEQDGEELTLASSMQGWGELMGQLWENKNFCLLLAGFAIGTGTVRQLDPAPIPQGYIAHYGLAQTAARGPQPPVSDSRATRPQIDALI